MSKSVQENEELIINEAYSKYYDSPLKSNCPTSARKPPIKILPTYIFNLSTPKKIAPIGSSKKSTPKSPISITSQSKTSDKKSKRKLTRSTSAASKPKKRINLCGVPNLQIELEKLIRAVYRHCVVCPELKSELKRIKADGLLQHYAKYRLQDF